MTTTLRSTIGAQLGWTWRDKIGTSLVSDSSRLQFSRDLADGSDAYQADAIWHAEDQVLAAGQSATFELDMLQQSLFGDVITIPLVTVKAILIVNKSSAAGNCLLVGGAGGDEWHGPFGAPGDTVRVMPDSPLVLASTRDGWAVNPSNRRLKIAAVGGAATFDVAILGTLPGGSESSSSSGA